MDHQKGQRQQEDLSILSLSLPLLLLSTRSATKTPPLPLFYLVSSVASLLMTERVGRCGTFIGEVEEIKEKTSLLLYVE